MVSMFVASPNIPRPCENRVRQDSGPIGSAWRVSEDREKAKRRAERLGLTIQGDFEVAVGTAGINKEKPAPQGNPATASIPVAETPEGSNDRPAKPDSLDGGTYGEEMSAIAMGDHSSLQGPGKVMSMGSSSYVTDMVSRFCIERGVFVFFGTILRRWWLTFCQSFFFFSLAHRFCGSWYASVREAAAHAHMVCSTRRSGLFFRAAFLVAGFKVHQLIGMLGVIGQGDGSGTWAWATQTLSVSGRCRCGVRGPA